MKIDRKILILRLTFDALSKTLEIAHKSPYVDVVVRNFRIFIEAGLKTAFLAIGSLKY